MSMVVSDSEFDKIRREIWNVAGQEKVLVECIMPCYIIITHIVELKDSMKYQSKIIRRYSELTK